MSQLKRFNYIKHPAVYSVIPFALGILISYSSVGYLPEIDPSIVFVLQLILAIISIFIYSKLSSSFDAKHLIFFILLFVFGFIRFGYVYNRDSEGNISSLAKNFKDKEVLLYGTVLEQPDFKNDRVRLIIGTDSIKFGSKIISAGGNVQAAVYKNRYRESAPKRINYGDKIQLTGKIEALPHRRNPGEFDYGEYLKLHGVDASFTSFGFENIKFVAKSDPSFYKSHIIYPVKAYSIKIINKLVGGEEGEFLKGLVLGERSNISKETKEEFVNAGVSHIIAVSGLNVAYVLIIIGALLLPIPIKQSYKIFIMIAFLIFYMNLTGNVPLIVRATIMASVFLLSQVFERKTISYNIIAFSALVILLIDPQQLFDAGFILSYSAILSILYFYPKLNKIVASTGIFVKLSSGNIIHKSVRALILLVLGTLAAQIGTIPITALMFKKISVVSLFTNVAAIPLSNVALAIGFIMIIVSTFSMWLAGVFASSAAFLLHWLLAFIDFSAKLDFSFIETYWADWLMLIFYYAFVFTLFTAKKKNLNPRLVIASLVVINFFMFRSILNDNPNLRLIYFDVGNSNSCLISSPNGENILINTGTSTVKYTSAERNIIPYLKSRGVSDIDLLVITSLNKNEFRNMLYFVKNFPIKKILVPAYYKPIFEKNEYASTLSGRNIKFVSESQLMSLFPDIRFYIIYDYKNLNTGSMLVHLLYGNELFTFSDSKGLTEEYYYSIFNITDSTRVLRVPASGSFSFTTPESIIRANPESVVISSNRSRKSPNSDIFSGSLKEMGINVYNIGELGAVIFETDGERTEKINW